MVDKRNVLIVEDNELNREILCEIMSEKYNAVEAENGKVGLEILRDPQKKISLVILDINMPVMNGYEFLQVVSRDKKLSTIPIIVATASDSISDEIKCLDMGATDFITKPYNPDICLKRVNSLIRLSEASAMLNLVRHDSLTGMYSKEFFFDRAAKLLDAYPDESFDLICCDVESFKMVNERYGVRRGDEVLKLLAEALNTASGERDICGRLVADVFVVITPHVDRSIHLEKNEICCRKIAEKFSSIVLKSGVYENVDRDVSVATMCDRARLAADSIKGHYGEMMAFYDEKLRKQLIMEQEIVDAMETALTEEQFKVYYQPKHNLMENKIGGAEALVRWIHPKYGFMNPAQFIPIFEQNGFITKLDFYVWKKVCRDLREWKERGLPMVPVSVNASRTDFDVLDLDQRIKELADEYEIEPKYLHVEVTESAYSDNPKRLKDVVEGLISEGFLVELDDFGAGYTSLNILDDLPINILKLDMSLVRKMTGENKGRSALTFALHLAEMMKLESVAEGVETKEQADKLRDMGCTYAQGYFYSKPIPKEEFENYLLKG